MYKNKIVKIFWLDAIIYKDKVPTKLPKKITKGILIKKRDGYVLVKNPITSDYDEKKKKYVVKQGDNHTFFYIPVGMIVKIES